MIKITQYLDDVGKEMRKVSWPSRQELTSNTLITILATIVISLLIFVTDRTISTVLEVIYG
jgi:preprotein translocase subunit SecE